MVWRIVLACVAGYLVGSFPTAYLVGRWVKGIDIRRYGTGNVGASNVWNTVGRLAAVLVAAVDIGKGALSAWLAMGPLDLGYTGGVVAGLCAAAGHAWSLYLGFTGGRALGSMIGTLLVVFPVGGLLQVATMLLGFVIHVEHFTTIGLLVLPLLSLALRQPPAVTWGCVGILLLTAIKRVEANRAPLPTGPERWRVVLRRLWLDRDVPSHEEWIARRPADVEGKGEG